MSLGRTALAACIVSVLPLLLHARNLILTLAASIQGGDIADARWFIPYALLLCVMNSVMPLFLFALYRERGTWRIPKPMRWLSLAAAMILALFVAAAARVESLDPWYIIRGGSRTTAAARVLPHLDILFTAFTHAAVAALLVSFFLHTRQTAAREHSRSRLLVKATWAALLVYGLELTFVLIRVLNTAWHHVVAGAIIRPLLIQACLFTVPFVIYRSQWFEIE